MGRTTAEAVGLIIDVDATISVAPFIEAANSLVTSCCGDSDTYTSTDLELIERWLSAHFYAIRDPQAISEKAGDVAVKYMSKVELGFDVTHHGQQAMRLDVEGGLARLNNKIKNGSFKTAAVVWLGTERVQTT